MSAELNQMSSFSTSLTEKSENIQKLSRSSLFLGRMSTLGEPGKIPKKSSKGRKRANQNKKNELLLDMNSPILAGVHQVDAEGGSEKRKSHFTVNSFHVENEISQDNKNNVNNAIYANNTNNMNRGSSLAVHKLMKSDFEKIKKSGVNIINNENEREKPHADPAFSAEKATIIKYKKEIELLRAKSKSHDAIVDKLEKEKKDLEDIVESMKYELEVINGDNMELREELYQVKNKKEFAYSEEDLARCMSFIAGKYEANHANVLEKLLDFENGILQAVNKGVC